MYLPTFSFLQPLHSPLCTFASIIGLVLENFSNRTQCARSAVKIYSGGNGNASDGCVPNSSRSAWIALAQVPKTDRVTTINMHSGLSNVTNCTVH